MAIATGILTNGLGGDASSMILGSFHLGFTTVTVTPTPEEPTTSVTGGGGGDYDSTPIPATTYNVTFNIKRKGLIWNKTYIVNKRKGLVLIKILKVATRITDAIRVNVSKIKKRIGNIFIKIK